LLRYRESVRGQAPGREVNTVVGDPQDRLGQITILAGTLLGRRYVVKDGVTIGRAADADIALEDAEVSRAHARIERAPDGRFFASDLGSRNGTYVNGAQIERAPLTFGDKLRVGATSMVFTRHDEFEEERIQRHRLETLGRMCVGVVHDLNNALCVVSSSVAYLRDQETACASEQRECLEDIQAASDRAAQLSRQLVAFARGTGDGPRRMDVAALCTEATKLARRTFPQSISITARLEPGLFVLAESPQLHQILMNLCVNARDAILATGRQGTILIESRRGLLEPRPGQPPCVIVSVHDDGMGMDERTRAHLFEPFFTTKGEGGGFGMGLATVADLVTQLGGHIHVESTPGAGSVFSIELPMAPDRADPAVAVTGSPTPRGTERRGNGERILVVDDDPGVRRSFARVLRHAGYAVLEAGDGVEGLQLLSRPESAISVVLLDLDMPKMGGEEMLGRVRHAFPRLPVLIVSGHTGPETLARVRARGAHGLIAKPCGSEELLAYIGRSLEAAAARGIFEEHTAVSRAR